MFSLSQETSFKPKRFIDTNSPVRLVGKWAWFTSIYGFAGILLIIIILVLGTSYGYQVVSQPCTDNCEIYGQLTTTNFQDLQKIGVSGETYAILYLIVLWIFTITALGVSALILWKKPGELVPFSAALLILSLPAIEGQIVFFSELFQDYPGLGTFFDYYGILGNFGMVYLFLTFPNGKFKAKIFWFLFVALVITGIAPILVNVFIQNFGIDYQGDTTTLSLLFSLPLILLAIGLSFIREKNFTGRNIVRYLALILVCAFAILVTSVLSEFLVYLVALIYRSRTVLSPRERVPARWLIYGFAVFVAMSISLVVIPPLFPELNNPDSYFFIVQNLIGFFGCGIILTGLLFAVLYANAFDINVVIKRTITYTALTMIIAGIYIGSIIGLQGLVRGLTGQETDLAIVGATLVSIVLFQPLRKAIQGFVDRRFYRRKYDAARTIAELNERLKTEMDLRTLTGQINAVLLETMQPQTVSIWVKSSPQKKVSLN